MGKYEVVLAESKWSLETLPLVQSLSRLVVNSENDNRFMRVVLVALEGRTGVVRDDGESAMKNRSYMHVHQGVAARRDDLMVETM